MARLLLVLAFWTCHTQGTRLALRAARNHGRKKNHTLDCTGWVGSGACTKCEATETDLVGALVYQLSCRACSKGHVLGTPEAIRFMKMDNSSNLDVFWDTECYPLVGEERHLIMIRHGESLWNQIMEETKKAAGVVGLLVGTDSPLSPQGLRQAQRLALVLKKTAHQIYGVSQLPANVTQDGDFLKVVAARSELEMTQAEEALQITETATGRLISDEELVNNLVREENREDVDVLLGKKCSDTNFVTSQLARAMDTFLIATIESRLNCVAPWFISSNLQEIEHNSDCTPKTEPHHRPEMAESQKKSYFIENIFRAQEYVEARYQQADVSQYKKNFGTLERARWNDQSPQMNDELDAMFATKKKYNVWGGHSIWFRHFFQEFADLSSPLCKKLQDIKMANTAMVSLRLRRVDPNFAAPGMRYAAYDCKWLHLGDDEDFKSKLDKDSLPRLMVPDPKDFDKGVSQIFGWKCCCSRSDYKDANVYLRTRKSLEKCVLVKTNRCKTLSAWDEVFKQEDGFMEIAQDYDWGHNRGPCTA